jgi:hypothetical protein
MTTVATVVAAQVGAVLALRSDMVLEREDRPGRLEAAQGPVSWPTCEGRGSSPAGGPVTTGTTASRRVFLASQSLAVPNTLLWSEGSHSGRWTGAACFRPGALV